MLSLPSQHTSTPSTLATHPAVPNPEPTINEGIWGYTTPKRSQALAQRESDIAQREAEIARREVEILVGAPGRPRLVPPVSPRPSPRGCEGGRPCYPQLDG